jgi:hypothetical protein
MMLKVDFTETRFLLDGYQNRSFYLNQISSIENLLFIKTNFIIGLNYVYIGSIFLGLG